MMFGIQAKCTLEILLSIIWHRKQDTKNPYTKLISELKNFELKLQKDPLNSMLKKSIANVQHQFNALLSQEIVHKMKLSNRATLNPPIKLGNG